MNTVFKGAMAATLLAGSTLAATAPAQAHDGGAAVVAGIAGLAIGAALASNSHGGYYYDQPAGYYAPAAPAYYGGGYGYAPTYSYAPTYAYGGGYYGGGSYYRGGHGGWDRGRHHDRHDNGRHNGWYKDRH